MKESIKFIKENVKKNSVVVMGISGGPDSMVLMSLFNDLKKSMNLTLVCAHVNHNLREESAEEKVFIENYCKNNNIIFEYMKIEEYSDDNFHNQARIKRYDFFENIINKYKATYLTTAHHSDDLMETILMRIARGSTLKGYSGFSKIVKQDTYEIVRPLIMYAKSYILDYAKENNIEYRIDKSNFKDVYTRNRYRNHVLPFLKDEDENVHLKFLKFSETLQEYENFIDNLTQEKLDKVIVDNKINIKEFKKLGELLQTRIINEFLAKAYQDDLFIINDNHTKLIIKLVNSSKANAVVNMPNDLICKKRYDYLSIEKEIQKSDSYKYEFNDIQSLPNGKTIEKVDESNNSSNYTIRLNSKDIKLPLIIRTRDEGDKISVKGMNGSKKVNNIFTTEKLTKETRDEQPLVTDSKNEILWIPGVKKSKFDKAKNEEYDIVLVYY